MPHVPRRYASTAGVSPELTTVPRQPPRPDKPPVPYHGSFEGEQAPELNAGGGENRISVRKWEYPASKIYKQLFGKDAERDEYTGGLVPKD